MTEENRSAWRIAYGKYSDTDLTREENTLRKCRDEYLLRMMLIDEIRQDRLKKADNIDVSLQKLKQAVEEIEQLGDDAVIRAAATIAAMPKYKFNGQT